MSKPKRLLYITSVISLCPSVSTALKIESPLLTTAAESFFTSSAFITQGSSLGASAIATGDEKSIYLRGK